MYVTMRCLKQISNIKLLTEEHNILHIFRGIDQPTPRNPRSPAHSPLEAQEHTCCNTQ